MTGMIGRTSTRISFLRLSLAGVNVTRADELPSRSVRAMIRTTSVSSSNDSFLELSLIATCGVDENGCSGLFALHVWLDARQEQFAIRINPVRQNPAAKNHSKATAV
jgi:hypothetical protein